MTEMKFSGRALLLIVFSVFHLNGVDCWDNDELELFDLVEEINENFYTLLGVEQSATGADVRRAYRKLSLQLHPDKNKEANAEVKFRQLVAAYEVLKDESKRAKYNEILVNGLPNWRQPVYYYRQVRKMGLIEMTILLSIILTVGQFLIIWSVYFERRFEKEEVFRSKKKRDKKKSKQQTETAEDEVLNAELEQIQKPRISDLLPCLLVRLSVRAVLSLPSFLRFLGETIRTALERQKVEETCTSDNEDDVNGADAVHRQRRKKLHFAETLPSAYERSVTTVEAAENQEIGNASNVIGQQNRAPKEPSDKWTDAEVELLSKAVIKFPGATRDRWEKIAQMVGRSVKEATSKAKELKAGRVRSVDPAQQGVTLALLLNNPPPKISLTNDLSKRDDYAAWNREPTTATTQDRGPVRRTVGRSLEKTSTINTSQPHAQEVGASSQVTVGQTSATSPGDALLWTQMQQRLLESALVQYPKGSADRWDRVAELIPGKTKEDCIQRFKYLADVVKQKQLRSQTSASDPSTTSQA